MLVADTFARVLGAIGTGVTLVLALLGYLAYRRDRPKLAIRLQITGTKRGMALEVGVVNDGRHPVALAGVYVGDGPPAGPDPQKPLRRTRGWILRRFPRSAWRPTWLIRLLTDRDLSVTRDGDRFASPIFAVGARDITEPVVLAPGDIRMFLFPNKTLHVLGIAVPALYVSAVDVLGRSVRQRVPHGIRALVGPPIRSTTRRERISRRLRLR